MDITPNFLNDTYHIIITDRIDQHIMEWFGDLTLTTQDNGEICIDLNIQEQSVDHKIQDCVSSNDLSHNW